MNNQERWISKLSRTVLNNNAPPLSVTMFAKATQFFHMLTYGQAYARLTGSEEFQNALLAARRKIKAVQCGCLWHSQEFAVGYVNDKIRHGDLKATREVMFMGSSPPYSRILEELITFLEAYIDAFDGFIAAQHSACKKPAERKAYAVECMHAWWCIAKHRRESCAVQRIPMERKNSPLQSGESFTPRLFPLTREKYAEFFRSAVYQRLSKAKLLRSRNRQTTNENGENIPDIDIIFSSTGQLPMFYIRDASSSSLQVIPSIHPGKIKLKQIAPPPDPYHLGPR